MKSTPSLFFGYLMPVMCLGSGLTAFALLGRQPDSKQAAPPRRSEIVVQVVQPQPYNGGIRIDAAGVAVPFRELQLSSQVAGEIIEKSPLLQQGRFVEAGTVLLRIDPRDYEIAVERLQKQFEQSAAELQSLRVELSNTERLLELAQESLMLSQRELGRAEGLLARGAGAEASVDQMRRTELTSREALTRLQNEQRTLRAREQNQLLAQELTEVQLKQARLDLERTELRAPFSGVVVSVAVEQHATVAAGTPVAVLDDTSAAEVLCQLRSDDADIVLSRSQRPTTDADSTPWDLPPLPATVTYQRAGRTYVWQAVLDRQDGLGLDEKTRTLPCRLLVREPLQCEVVPSGSGGQPLALLRGMFVGLTLHAATDQPLLSIPETAIRPGKRVWVADDGCLRIREVQVVRLQNGQALLDPAASGLQPDDQVIVSPIPNARDGIRVRIRDAAETASPAATAAPATAAPAQTSLRLRPRTTLLSAAPAGARPVEMTVFGRVRGPEQAV